MDFSKMTPEQINEYFIKQDEKIKQLENDNKSLTEEQEKSKTRITELQEHNQKLFLRVTTKQEDKQETKNEDNISMEEYLSKLGEE
jgi:hypothetical protein